MLEMLNRMTTENAKLKKENEMQKAEIATTLENVASNKAQYARAKTMVQDASLAGGQKNASLAGGISKPARMAGNRKPWLEH